jgi:hypothetical protein
MKTKPITRPMTKSPRRIALEALHLAQQALPAYSCLTSRHDFTQAQLFAVLTLKTFFKTDYRGIADILRDWLELQRALGLTKVPHYSTLCYAEQRLLKKGGFASSSGGPCAAPACAA